ncbi:MAG TPA: FAD-dependent oxidoreductase [Thermoleophilia bacterium]|nr:FAD-dependent oxidoreductase [Thermoleophilia bacterium]
MNRVLILGGGFGGVAAARHLAPDPGGSNDLEVRLINRTNFLTYTPFLADVAGGTIAVVHAVPPLRAMAPQAQIEVADIETIDIAAQQVTVRLPDGRAETRGYDYLVIALGATTSFRHGAGASEFGLSLATVADAYLLRNRVLEMLELASVSRDPALRRELLTFVFCGGGFSGIEGAAAIEDLVHEALSYYPSIAPGEPRFILAPHGDRLLEQIDERLGVYVLERLRRRSVDVRLGVGVTALTARSATLSTGEVVPTRTVLWAAGIEVNPLLRDVDLPKDAHGALRVSRTLQVEGHDNVFALGDCAAVPTATPGAFYGPTAQNAEREGPVAAANIAALLRHEPAARRFDYAPIGSLASLGHREAVAQIRGLKVTGIPAWFLWRGVYLGKLPRFSRKLQVMLDWGADLVSPAEIAYLPLGPHAPVRATSDEGVAAAGEPAGDTGEPTAGTETPAAGTEAPAAGTEEPAAGEPPASGPRGG